MLIQQSLDNYPNSFYSFEDGIDLSNRNIIDMLQKTYDILKNTDENCYYIATGNTIVIGFKRTIDNINKSEYEFIVSKKYHNLTILNKDILEGVENDPKEFFQIYKS